MTRAARRATTLLLAGLTAALLSLALLAGEASATEGSSEGGEQATAEEDSGFGSGQWDGMLLTAAVGLVVGGVIFAMSEPEEIQRATAHH